MAKKIRFTPDEYNYYVNWAMKAVLGRLSEADALMREHGKPIRSMAKKLVKRFGVPKRPIYRGVVLDPGEAPGGLLPANDYTFVSWSEDRDVACWFADRDSVISGFVRMIRPQISGWIAESWPDPKRVLFHWSWAPKFPAPHGEVTIPLWKLSQLHPDMIPAQVEWAMKSQREVILRQDGKPIKVRPFADMKCPPTAELDGRLTFRPNPVPHSEEALRHLYRKAVSGDIEAGVELESRIASMAGRCACQLGCDREFWHAHARDEVERDFDEHGGYRPTFEGLVFDLRSNPPRALAKLRHAVGKGHECYPAAEVLYHKNGGGRAGLTPMQQRHEGRSHWWVRGPEGEVWDPASAQFRTPVPYDRGVGKGFLTKKPSRRARALARRAGVRLNPYGREGRPRLKKYEVWVSYRQGSKMPVLATSANDARAQGAEFFRVPAFNLTVRSLEASDKPKLKHPWVDPPYWRRNPEAGASADVEEFRAAIPKDWKQWADSLEDRARRRVTGNWWVWWVGEGRDMHRARQSQGYLFSDWDEGPWAGAPPRGEE
jgi:hypothetical protein